MRWWDPTRLVVWVIGTCETADRLRAAFTLRSGYVLSPLGVQLTIAVDEQAGVDLTVDGVMTQVEAYVMTEISTLTPSGAYRVLRAAGQNFDDRRLALVVPLDPVVRVAVQEGVVNGLDRWRQGRGEREV